MYLHRALSCHSVCSIRRPGGRRLHRHPPLHRQDPTYMGLRECVLRVLGSNALHQWCSLFGKGRLSEKVGVSLQCSGKSQSWSTRRESRRSFMKRCVDGHKRHEGAVASPSDGAESVKGRKRSPLDEGKGSQQRRKLFFGLGPAFFCNCERNSRRRCMRFEARSTPSAADQSNF